MFNRKNFFHYQKKNQKVSSFDKTLLQNEQKFFNKFFIIIIDYIEYFRLVVRLPAKAMKVMNKFQQQQQQQTEKPFELTKTNSSN